MNISMNKQTPIETVKYLIKFIAKKEKFENCDIIIKEIPAGAANFSGYIYAVQISAPTKDRLRLFVKLATVGATLQEFVSQIYGVETFFYSVLLKSFRRLEEKYEIAKEYRLPTAKFYECNGGNKALVLEDLTAAGYKTLDRIKSVTWEQTIACLKQLVKFHALSLALSKEMPKEYEKSKEKLISWQEFLKNVVFSTRAGIIEAVDEKDKCRIDKFIEDKINNEHFSYVYKPIRKDIIIHGDFRPSNLMYKLVNGRYEVIPVDMQAIRCGSPAFDLMYFINLGTDNELRKNKFQAIIDLYYQELSDALWRLSIDPREAYSREDFDYELKAIMPYVVMFTMCALLIVKVDENDAPKQLDNFSMKDFGYSPNKRFKRELKEYIEFYTEMGVIPYC